MFDILVTLLVSKFSPKSKTVIFSDAIYYLRFTFFATSDGSITYRALQPNEQLKNLELVNEEEKVTKRSKSTNVSTRKNRNKEPYYKQGHIGYNYGNLQHSLGGNKYL